MLSVLSNTLIYVPIFRVESIAGKADEKKVSIVTVSDGDERHVSVFTEEERFFEWAGEEPYQCFTVAAGDLALTLPKNTWITIDPGSAHEQTFSPEEVDYLAYPIPDAETSQSELEYRSDFGLVSEQLPDSLVDELSQTEKASMRDELKQLLGSFLSIDEGYFVDFPDQGLVGILGEEMPSEERFSLIESVAEISRKYFGEAGSIEVYDDLKSSVSPSWQMFSAQTPIYIRSKDEAPPLNLQRDLLHDENAEYTADEEEEKGTLWQRLRRRYRF